MRREWKGWRTGREGGRERGREGIHAYLLNVLPELLLVDKKDCFCFADHAVGTHHWVELHVASSDIVEPGNFVQSRKKKSGSRLRVEGRREGGKEGGTEEGWVICS